MRPPGETAQALHRRQVAQPHLASGKWRGRRLAGRMFDSRLIHVLLTRSLAGLPDVVRPARARAPDGRPLPHSRVGRRPLGGVPARARARQRRPPRLGVRPPAHLMQLNNAARFFVRLSLHATVAFSTCLLAPVYGQLPHLPRVRVKILKIFERRILGSRPIGAAAFDWSE